MTTPYTHLHDAALSLDAAARSIQGLLNQAIYRNVPDGRFSPIVAIAQRLGAIQLLAAEAHRIANTLADPEQTQPQVPAAGPIPPNRPAMGHSSGGRIAGGGS